MQILTPNAEVVLKLLLPIHSQELFHLADANRMHLREWFTWVDRTISEADTQQFIQSCLTKLCGMTGFNCGIWYQDQLVGVLEVHDWKHALYRAELGYWLSKEATGKGIMTVAVQGLIDYLFQDLPIHALEIRCAVRNEKSQQVAIRCGFQLEGKVRQGTVTSSGFEDVFLYSLLREDWMKHNSA